MKVTYDQNRKQKGLTLVEILVVLGIFALISFFGVSLFFSLLRSSRKTEMIAKVKQNGDYAINVMERAIRSANSLGEEAGNSSSVTVLSGDEEHVFSCELGGTGGNSLFYKIDGEGGRMIDKDLRVESPCGQFFYITKGDPGASPDKVKIEFTLSANGGSRPEEQASVDFQTTVVLRNF